MATIDYSRFQETARRLIERFGGAATLRKRARAARPGLSATPTDHAVTAVLTAGKVNSRPQTAQGADTEQYEESAGTLQAHAMRAAYLRGDGVVPQISDTLIMAGTEWTISDVKSLQPDGVATLFHRLELRS